jgi:hypothetical protein
MHRPRSGMSPRLAAVSVLLALTACSSGARPAPLPPSPLLVKAVSFERPGPLRHDATGFEFAERYGAFERVSARRYDTEGLNVGIGYDDRQPECTIVTTFYVYPTPETPEAAPRADTVVEDPRAREQSWLDAELAMAHRSIRYNNPAMLLPQLSIASTPSARGTLAGLQLAFRDTSYLSELRLFVWSKRWFLKYRFTYPETCEAEASQRIAALVAAMPWSRKAS